MSLIHAGRLCYFPSFWVLRWKVRWGNYRRDSSKTYKLYMMHLNTCFLLVPNIRINHIYLEKCIMEKLYSYFYLSKHVKSFKWLISLLRFGCLTGEVLESHCRLCCTTRERHQLGFITASSIYFHILWWACAGIAYRCCGFCSSREKRAE